jgi:hypothetical protein
MNHETDEKIMLGWREWVSLPELGLRYVKAKVDTGARTSALHAFEVDSFSEDGKKFVRFNIHPNQRDNDTVVTCVAAVIDERDVRDSGGHREKRWVIETPMTLGKNTWTVELTLTSRDDMMFRMLLGRTAIKNRALVDVSRSYLTGKRKKKKKKRKANK